MSDITVWIAVFALGLVGLNWPVLAIFDEDPFTYLLAFWLLFLVLVMWTARGGKAPPPR